MSRSVDTRVVQMDFDNSKFERNVSTTQKTLEKLKSLLNFNDAGKGFTDIDRAASKVNLSPLEKSVQAISDRFSNLGIVGITVLQNLTNRAVDTAFKIGNALTSAITTGGKNRALNLEAAEFQIEGLGYAWEDVEEDISYGVKNTAYGLDAAAKAASQLLASQVKTGDQMKASLRGISGVAAMTSSSYEDIANIFTTVAGNGRLMGDQLMQLSSRGLNAAATLADALGVSEQEVRDMVSKGKIDFETFATAMDNAFGEHAKDANKTFTGALSNMKAALARIGAAFYTPGFDYARDVINALTPVIDDAKAGLEPFISLVSKCMKVISKFAVDALGKLDAKKFFNSFSFLVSSLVPGFNNIRVSALKIFDAIKSAFTSIFPPIENINSRIIGIGNAFTNFTRKLKPSQETLNKLTRVFKGFFAILDLGRRAISFVISLFGSLLSVLSPLGIILLDVAAKIGDFLVKIDESAKKSELFSNALEKIQKVLSSFSEGIKKAYSSLKEFVSNILPNAVSALSNIGSKIKDALKGILDSAGNFGSELAHSFTFSDVLGVITAGLFGGILVKISKFIKMVKENFEKSESDGIMTKVKSLFDDLSKTLNDFSNSIKANILIKIAIAMGILAASCVALAGIDSGKLGSSLGAITVMFGELFAFMAGFSSIVDGKSLLGMSVASGAMIKLAAAVLILSFAVEKMAKLNLKELAKGLGGVAALCITLGATMKFADFSKIKASSFLGLIGLATSLYILSSAVGKLGSIDLKSLVKGLGSIVVILAALVGFINLLKTDKMANMVVIGAGLILVATSMVIFTKAVEKLGSLSLKTLAKGLGSIAIMLVAVGGALRLFPNGAKILASATGLLMISVAINVLAAAVEKLGNMSIEQLVKGLGAMAIALGVFVAALGILSSLANGPLGAKILVVATAIGILAASMTLLTPALLALGNMSLGQVITSLGMLAGVFIILGAAAAILSPIIPAIIGLSAAVALFGVGIAAFGIGLAAFSAGVSTLAVSAPIVVEAISTVVLGILSLLDEAAVALANAVASFIQTIIDRAPTIIEGLTVLLETIIESLIEVVPKVMELVTVLIESLITTVTELLPKIITLGVNLILSFLQGIADSIYMIATTAANIVIGFLNAISEKLPEIIQAGFELLISFLNGMADAVQTNGGTVLEAVWNLVTSIIESVLSGLMNAIGSMLSAGEEFIGGAVDGISKGIQWVKEKVTEIVRGAIDKVRSFIGNMLQAGSDFIGGAVDGIARGIQWVKDKVHQIVTGAVDKVKSFIGNMLQAGSEFIQGAVNGIANGIQWVKDKVAEIGQGAIDTIYSFFSNMFNAGKDLIQGLIDGVGHMGQALWDAVGNIASGAIDTVKSWFGIASPSKVFRKIGVFTMEGFILGVSGMTSNVDKAVRNVGSEAIDVMRETLANVGKDISDGLSSDITITPVLDLTDVNRGINDIYSSFNKTASISLEATSIRANSALRVNSVNGVNDTESVQGQVVYNNYDFTQNNYSPKALSRIDIYRDTKNQFSRLKGVTA